MPKHNSNIIHIKSKKFKFEIDGFTAQLQSHVMVPLVQVSTDAKAQANYGADLDLMTADVDDLLALIVEVVSRRYIPKLHSKGNTDFQLTRGLLGISM